MVYRGDSSNYGQILPRLRPGDTLLLAPGTYARGLRLHNVHGSPEARITIAGPRHGPPAVFLPRDGYHTVSLRNSSHLLLRHLELDGQHKAVDGVKAEGEGTLGCIAVHDITLEDLYIHGHDHGQQTVAINTKCTAWNWIVRHSVIVGTGTGMYFGGSAGDTPFINGLIEHNLIVDTRGYNLQIKHQHERPSVSGLPSGPGTTIIRHNVFGKAANASGGHEARPNVLLGHWPLEDLESQSVYQVYGNLFYQNPSGEPLLQAEGNVAVHHNVLVNHLGSALWIRPHHDRPRAIWVFHNTVVATGDGIQVTGGDPRFTQKVAANAVFAARPLAGGDLIANVTETYRHADQYLRNPFGEPGHLDLRPKTGRLIGPAIALPELEQFEDWDRDFDGRPHDRTHRGAYAGEADGWRLDLARKPLVRGAESR